MSNVTKLNEYSDDVSNAELVKKSQLGDKIAFEELVRRHQELVFSLAYKLTGNRELANDVAQEAFIRAWKAIQKFRGDSTFSTWIYRITVNTAWTLRKKAKKHYSLNIEDTQEPVVIDEKKDPEFLAINSDLSSVLKKALEQIPIELRIIVELKDKFVKFEEDSIGFREKADNKLYSDALNALSSLGYNPRQSKQALNFVFNDTHQNNDNIELVIKAALTKLSE